MSWVDVVVVLLAIAAGISGWRHGLAVAALSFLGVLGGALLGLKIAPALVDNFEGTTSKIVVSVLLVVALVALGETLGVYLGRALRDRMRLPAVRTITPPGTVSAFLIAQHLVGDDPARVIAAVDDLTRRNRLRHPGSVPPEPLEFLA